MPSDDAKPWKIMRDIDFCMFVTCAGRGLDARPLSSIVREEEKSVCFLSVADSPQIADLAGNPEVIVTYGDGKTFLTLNGRAEVSRDRALIERLWNPGAQSAWPEGPASAPVVVIVFRPARGEYWEGDNAAVGAAKFLFALATRTRADMGENARFEIGR